MNKIYSVVLVTALLYFVPLISYGAEVFSQDLYYGIQGSSEVIKLQEFLTEEGVYSGPITGNYYSLTLKAVKNFQIKENIFPAAGYFGPKTRIAANAKLSNAIQESENQAILETGTGAPAPVESPLQVQINAMLQQIALLQQQLSIQNSNQTILQQQLERQNMIDQKIAQQTQVLQQLVPQNIGAPTTPAPQVINTNPAPVPIPIELGISYYVDADKDHLRPLPDGHELGVHPTMNGTNESDACVPTIDPYVVHNSRIRFKDIHFSVSPIAGKPKLNVSTPDESQNRTEVTASSYDGNYGFSYYPKYDGVHTIEFSIPELSVKKSIDVTAEQFSYYCWSTQNWYL